MARWTIPYRRRTAMPSRPPTTCAGACRCCCCCGTSPTAPPGPPVGAAPAASSWSKPWSTGSTVPRRTASTVRCSRPIWTKAAPFLLLDGLDEVPITVQRDGQNCHPREQLLSALADALPIWQQAGKPHPAHQSPLRPRPERACAPRPAQCRAGAAADGIANPVHPALVPYPGQARARRRPASQPEPPR